MTSAYHLTVRLFLLVASIAVAAQPERSVSTSRQFLVYGADVRIRGAICELAEKTKRNLLLLIDRRDEWTTPINVNLRYPQANLPETPPVALNVSQTGFGLKLQLDLTIAPDVNQARIEQELLRVILVEFMYRGRASLPAGNSYVPPPEWLVEGIPALRSDFDSAPLVAVLSSQAAAHRVASLDEFLRPRSDLPDAPDRSLYHAYSFALVDLLVHLPDGHSRLARFIESTPSAANDPLQDLKTHFAELADENGRQEKTWNRAIASIARRQSYQLLSVTETDNALNELLTIKIRDVEAGKNFKLEDFPRFISNRSAKSALNRLSRDLLTLSIRANPIYRPVVDEYLQITALLVHGKTKGIPERLARLESSRKGIATWLQNIDDYMNWFEATKSRSESGAFVDYFKAAESATRPEQKRRDAISVYLDALETQFQD